MNDDRTLIAFAESMGVPELSPELAHAFAERVGPVLLERVLMRAEETLSPLERDLAADFIQREDMPGLAAFLNERLPDFAGLLAEAAGA